MPPGRLCQCSGDVDAKLDEVMSRQPPHGLWGVVDPGSHEEGFGEALSNFEADQFRQTPRSGAATLVELLEKSRALFGTNRCVGDRRLVASHMVPDPSGREWEKLELENRYMYLEYKDYHQRVCCLATSFQNVLGIEQKSKVVIYAATQRDWMCCAFAAWYCNATVVTIYATLGPDGAAHGVNETESSVIITDAKPEVLDKLLPGCPHVRHVVRLTPGGDGVSRVSTTSHDKGDRPRKHLIGDLITDKPAENFSSKPTPQDTAVVMYTSGTTGAPKGVVITHANILAAVAGVENGMKGAIGPEDVYCAYLPLAHIMEMVAEVTMLALGAAVGFGTPSTLLDTGNAAKKLFGEEVKQTNPEMAPKLEHSIGDARLLAPTLMVFPPAVLDKIYQGVNTKIRAARLGWLLDRGLAAGEEARANNRLENGFFSGMLFKKKVQAMVGGKLRAILSGSAPLSPEVQVFVQTVFKAPVRQGYGLTETCAASCMASWGDFSKGAVGAPTIAVTIRLADWPEGFYMNSDYLSIGMPRGEVLIGGPTVSTGYYINPNNPNAELEKKNSEDWITIQGVRFFRTGDIGQITPEGTLQIIDRKKDLWKGPSGEYVALAKVESSLTLCPFVGLAMVYGRTGGDFVVALICPQLPAVMALGKELSIQGDFEALCKHKTVVERVSQACKDVCKQKKLLSFEIPEKFALVSELWTPENELLTAAMKLKRPQIARQHKNEIDAMYA